MLPKSFFYRSDLCSCKKSFPSNISVLIKSLHCIAELFVMIVICCNLEQSEAQPLALFFSFFLAQIILMLRIRSNTSKVKLGT